MAFIEIEDRRTRRIRIADCPLCGSGRVRASSWYRGEDGCGSVRCEACGHSVDGGGWFGCSQETALEAAVGRWNAQKRDYGREGLLKEIAGLKAEVERLKSRLSEAGVPILNMYTERGNGNGT